MQAVKKERHKGQEFTTVKLPVHTVTWLRERMAKDGRYMYQVIHDLFAKAMKGKRPWEQSK